MIEKEVLGPMITAGGSIAGTITAALIAWYAAVKLQDRASSRYRSKLGLVDPRGCWECEWFNEDGSTYVKDIVRVDKCLKKGAFSGRGVQPDLSYEVRGEIDSTRAMALTYRTEDFPTKAYVGVACLIFDMSGDGLTGSWYGRTRSSELAGGKTNWKRRPCP